MNKLVTVNTMTPMATVNHLKNRKSLTMTLKKAFLLCVTACLPAFVAWAQQIAVATPAGATTLYQDLNLAIAAAPAGSTVYLSGGGFHISDTTKIRKRLTIIGIGHRPDSENADVNTTVTGNFNFEGGANGSALMGVFLSGNVNLGTGGANGTFINGFLLRYCNVNSVRVHNGNCVGVEINQNYVRNNSHGGGTNIQFTNNILHSITEVDGGKIENNTILHSVSGYSLFRTYNSPITNNVMRYGGITTTELAHNNLIGTDDWDTVFVGPNNGVNTSSNFRLASGNNTIGIYGGGGFSDTGLPPGPRIVNKNIPGQTDANGNLRVQIQVSVE